ncbi:MAG: adenylate/guanylate cyclase domain-containing protein [Pseudomonadota bacterium]
MVRDEEQATGADQARGALFDQLEATVLFIDMVESVRLIELDDVGTVRRWLALSQAITADLAGPLGGRLVKRTGDGMLLEFPTAHDAVDAAMRIRTHAAAQNEGLDPDLHLVLRFGASTGPVLRTRHDLYGKCVNLAARLMQIARPDEIVVSEATRDQLADGLDAEIEDLGECFLRNVPDPIRAFRLGPPGESPMPRLAPAADFAATLAVLPFAPRRQSHPRDMLGEIIAEEAIWGLSSMPGLSVLSRLSTTAVAARRMPVDAAATALGADYVVHGSYDVDGKGLALMVELVDVAKGTVVWADRLTGSLEGFFDPEGGFTVDLVYRIASAIVSTEIERARGAQMPTLKAYTLILGAVALMHRLSRSDFYYARLLLEELAHRHPRQSLPLAWLADWHVMQVNQGWSQDPARDAGLAESAGKRALEADPDSALAMTMCGSVSTNLLRRLDDAERFYDDALALNPSEALARLFRAALYAFTDRGGAAVADAEEALRLSPYDPHRFLYESIAASAHLTAGDNAEALRLTERSLRRNRAHASSLRVKAVAEWRLGREETAQQTVDELMRLVPGFTVSGYRRRSPNADSAVGRDIAEILQNCGAPE